MYFFVGAKLPGLNGLPCIIRFKISLIRIAVFAISFTGSLHSSVYLKKKITSIRMIFTWGLQWHFHVSENGRKGWQYRAEQADT
jgi:hypothetical protein